MATIEAIYENGVFKPVEPVALPEQQRVQIDVRPIPQPTPRTGPSAELLHWAGAIDADVPDLCEHLDDYLGAALAQDLQAQPHG
jgi:predicted DNA-binding antitoxin AbrB/MazE fold protein